MSVMNRWIVFLLLVSALPGADKKVIQPKQFPTGRPFSPAILAGDTLHVSGQTGSDPATGKLPDTFDAEAKRCFDNIGIVLKEAGMGFEDVVAVQVYLTDMDLFQQMNSIYTGYFKEPRPARTTVGVTRLAGGAHLEVTVTARR